MSSTSSDLQGFFFQLLIQLGIVEPLKSTVNGKPWLRPMNAKKKTLTESKMATQAFIFLAAGYETSSLTNIVNMLYLPFGDSPRNCISLRMGNSQKKVELVVMLREFRKRCNEMKFNPKCFVLSKSGGMNLRVLSDK